MLLVISKKFWIYLYFSKTSETIISIIKLYIRLIILAIYLINSCNHIATLNTKTDTRIPTIEDLVEITVDVTCSILK